jgi:hypothetical protein
MRIPTIVVGAAFVALAVSGCSKKESITGPGPGAAAKYSGVFADGTGGGQIVVNIPSGTGTLTITGTLYTGAGQAPVTLGGTFISGTNALAATGGGWVITGVLVSGKLTGTYQNGARNGIYTLEHDVNNSAAVYCGNFTGDADGTWNLTVNGSSLSGAYAEAGGTPATLSGTVGASLGITFSSGTAAGSFTDAGHTAMSGTWTAGTSSGTWSGSMAACHS